MSITPARAGKEMAVSRWRGFQRASLILTTFFFTMLPAVFAQDAVPIEMLSRTLFIKAGNDGGTAFSIDYQGKIYLVTARHVVAGLPLSGATIQVWKSDQWVDYKTVRTLFPTSNDVDIAVFETSEKVPQPYEITPAREKEKEGPTFGQQVWFLGFPWGIGSRMSKDSMLPFMPFIKRGTMSAIDTTNPDAVVLYIDGFNNPGFSGGPIIYWDFRSHAYRILGVVQGYREDTAKVVVNGVHVDTQLLVNSGILVGYSIAHALQAIDSGQKTH